MCGHSIELFPMNRSEMLKSAMLVVKGLASGCVGWGSSVLPCPGPQEVVISRSTSSVNVRFGSSAQF